MDRHDLPRRRPRVRRRARGRGWILGTKRHWFLISAVLLGACGDDGSAPSSSVDQGPFGGVPPTADQFAESPKALPPEVFAAPSVGTRTALPARVELTDLPPARAQGTSTRKGSPGSCEVWSAGYVMGSYVANVANQRSLLDEKNTVSAGYVYAEVLAAEDGSCPHGTGASDTLGYLVRVGAAGQGAPSLADVAYEPSCTYIDGITVPQTFQTDLSIGSWSRLPASAEEARTLVKSQLNSGLPAQMTFQLPYGFLFYTSGTFSTSTSCPPIPLGSPACAISKDGGFACVADAGIPSGCAQHGIAIVGYDDDRGAFRIQNSFGQEWGEDGRMWMSYEAFDQTYVAGTLAQAVVPVAADTVAGHQAVDPHSSMSDTVHLVLRTALERPANLDVITVTPPGGPGIAQRFGHWFRSGALYVSRHDGFSWPEGSYDVEMEGEHRDGPPLALRQTIEIEALAGVDPRAPEADSITGTNGLPTWRP